MFTIKKANRFTTLGFTLIEVLVVIAIIGILATIGLGFYSSAQIKARDAQRKSDINQIGKALELYYQDFGRYPASTSTGTISTFAWGSPFTNVTAGGATTVYMAQLPRDPKANRRYYYISTPTEYRLYAKLENLQDPAALNSSGTENSYSPTCEGSLRCNYAKGSTNVTTF